MRIHVYLYTYIMLHFIILCACPKKLLLFENQSSKGQKSTFLKGLKFTKCIIRPSIPYFVEPITQRWLEKNPLI